jgi:hypothetical protein
LQDHDRHTTPQAQRSTMQTARGRTRRGLSRDASSAASRYRTPRAHIRVHTRQRNSVYSIRPTPSATSRLTVLYFLSDPNPPYTQSTAVRSRTSGHPQSHSNRARTFVAHTHARCRAAQETAARSSRAQLVPSRQVAASARRLAPHRSSYADGYRRRRKSSANASPYSRDSWPKAA